MNVSLKAGDLALAVHFIRLLGFGFSSSVCAEEMLTALLIASYICCRIPLALLPSRVLWDLPE